MVFTPVGGGDRDGVSSVPLLGPEFDCCIFIFPGTHMLISCSVFLSPLLALSLRGVPLLRRVHEGPSTQAPVHSE